MSAPWFIVPQNRNRSRAKSLIDNFSESELKKWCGMGAVGLQQLEEIFAPSLRAKTNGSIKPETKLLTYLGFLRSGCFQWGIGKMFGLCQGSVCNVVEEMTNTTLGLMTSKIKFPEERQQQQQIKRKYYNIARFPNILGCVDGTHVAIKRPLINEVVYVNRKQYHSINCQVIVDADFRFLDLVAKWPGASHDSFIWRNSSVRDRISNGEWGDGWLLGETYIHPLHCNFYEENTKAV